uniref:Uncharacterized protein n=1 Tax=Arundo donax TaxID=35708 RepID=A0A0A9CWH7_ARUDO
MGAIVDVHRHNKVTNPIFGFIRTNNRNLRSRTLSHQALFSKSWDAPSI